MIKYFIKLVISILILLMAISTVLIYLGNGFGNAKYMKLGGSDTLIFAHRGAGDFVENSIEAFNFAKRLGFKSLETDVSITADDQIIIFHDENCSRLLGIDAQISDLNFGELRDSFLIYKSIKTSNKILLLDEFLTLYQDSFLIYLDIKVSSKLMADSILNIMKRHNHYNTITVADASLPLLAYLKFKDEKIITTLEGYDENNEWTFKITPDRFKPDYYSSPIEKVTNNHLKYLVENKMLERRLVFGINSKNYDEFKQMKVNNFIIDFDSTLFDKQLPYLNPSK